MKTIAILTDFGTQDPFVGIMKGVIAKIAPDVRIIDISNHIPPGAIRQGALNLWQALPYFPESTVFLGVVDPGVGSERAAMLLQSNQHLFVGPDNGLFSYVSGVGDPAWRLENPELQISAGSTTFHGRDVFAPAAAHAAMGTAPDQFGRSLTSPTRLPALASSQPAPGSWDGEIVYADHFGNLLTSLGPWQRRGPNLVLGGSPGGDPSALEASFLSSWRRASVLLGDGRILASASTFSAIRENECAVLIGSSGLLELAAQGRSAAAILGLQPGDPVRLNLNLEMEAT